jgi:hypothetical protein
LFYKLLLFLMTFRHMDISRWFSFHKGDINTVGGTVEMNFVGVITSHGVVETTPTLPKQTTNQQQNKKVGVFFFFRRNTARSTWHRRQKSDVVCESTTTARASRDLAVIHPPLDF